MMNKDKYIPQGNKPSPLGPIPEGWEVKRLGDYVTITSGESPSLYVLKTTGRFPYVKVEDMNNCSKYQTQSREYSDIEKSVVPKGSIIFPKRGAAILNNKVRIAQTDLLMDSNMMAITPKDGQLDSEYLYYTIIKEQLYKIADTSTIPQINNKHIIPYRFCLPSLVEQKEIVSLLITWDTAIVKQTALIEKLTLRKRGLMQQLLTGKKRLEGFGGEWKEVRLGEIGKFVGGCAFNEQEQGGQTGIPFYKVSDMNLPGNESKMNIANNYVTHEQIERLGYIVIENEAIIFAKVGAAIALERKRCAKNFIIDNNMLAYLPNNNVWYMKYWFDSISLSKYIQVGALPSYNASDLSIIKLKMPSLKEQNAIASVLVNADKEIEIQKQKLAAIQTQKKGLMQVLLTGERRIK